MSKNKLKRKLGDRLFNITILATFFVLFLSNFLTFRAFYKIAEADANSIGEKAVFSSYEKLNNFLMNGLDVLTVTSEAVEYMMKKKSSISDIREFLVNETENYSEKFNKDFTGLYGYIDENYVDGAGWVPPENYDPKSRDWFLGAYEKLGQTVLIPPYVDEQTGDMIISISRMLYDWSVLALDIKLGDFQNYIQQSVDFYGEGFIIDRSGLIVAHTDKSQVKRNLLKERYKSDDTKRLVQTIFLRDSEDGLKRSEIKLNGEMCVVFSKQVQGDWFVVSVLPESVRLEKLQNTLILSIFLSVFILAVVIFFSVSTLKNRKRLELHRASLQETIKKKTKEIESRNQELVDFQQNVIEGVAQLIESRDGSTGEHVKNTKKYVLMLAEKVLEIDDYVDELNNNYFTSEYNKDKPSVFELKNSFMKAIGNAATLHDVGKIHIPDYILKKNAALNDEEYKEMKKHSEYGAEVIKKIFGNAKDRNLEEITHNVVRHHHEHWDGSGYPDKLAGKDIPLSARIMAIADVYDALLSKRHYKKSMEKAEVISIMKNGSGTQFDPELLEIFLELIK